MIVYVAYIAVSMFLLSDVVLSCVVFVCGHVGFVEHAGDEAVVV